MKRLIALAMVLVFAGCAAPDLTTEADWDQAFAQSEIAASMEHLKYEPTCNQLVLMYACGQFLRDVEKKEGKILQERDAQMLGHQIAKRMITDPAMQRALVEMLLIGHKGGDLADASSPEMETCLETDGERLQKYSELKLQTMKDAYNKK